MKQHITVDQLNELSDKGKENLLTYCKDKGYIRESYDDLGEWGKVNVKYSITLLSIGQMIEFLDDNKVDISYHLGYLFVDLDYDYDGAETYDKRYDNDELADALWEVVKEVLDKV